METSYLNLPIGSVSQGQLIPWLEWINLQDLFGFASFPGVINLFKERHPDKLESSYINDFDNSPHFLHGIEGAMEENIFFDLIVNLYKFTDANVVMYVRFFIDGTAVIKDDIYSLDSPESNYLAENVRILEQHINKAQDRKKLSWKEAVSLIEKIKLGEFNIKLKLPEF